MASPSLATEVRWGQGGLYWPTYHYGLYCASATVLGKTHWVDWIRSAIGKYNNIIGYTHPTWAYSGCRNYGIGLATANISGCGTTGNTVQPGTSTITHSEIRYNQGAYWVKPYITGGYNFHKTTLHEFGHSQGMPHSCTSTAVMWGTDSTQDTLTSDDKYAHEYLYSTFNGPPAANNACV